MVETRRLRFGPLLDCFQYAVVTTAIAFLGLTVPSLILGMGLVGVKIGLFVVALAYLGYGTYLAWPSSPDEFTRDDGDTTESPTRFQQFVRRLPPVAWVGLLPEAAYPDWVKVYVASLTMFATSYLMESVFGVVA